MTSRVSPVST